MPANSELSHRERVLLALDRQPTDRIPIAMVCSAINPPAHKAFETYLREHRNISVDDYLKPLIDIRRIGPRYVGPQLPQGTDIWGVHRSPTSYGSGSYDEIDHYPLAKAANIQDVLDYSWPTPAVFDVSVMPQCIADANKDGEQGGGEYCLMISNGNIFESAWYMRGFEQIFVDLVEQPDLVHVIFEKLTCFWIEHFRRILTASKGRIDLVFTGDDIGGQQGLLMSLATWKEHIKPYHVRLNQAIHEFGARVIYHSDGSIMDAVPELIDMGIDILQALQFDAHGMDSAKLKTLYGDRLGFQGGISVQKTLPFGTPGDVRNEVLDRVAILGKNGGYILGPSHAIQAGTPPQNILALFDTAATAPLNFSSTPSTYPPTPAHSVPPPSGKAAADARPARSPYA
ncbi:MAG: hypothetical protein FWD61_04685 [Phycisphaerales bacterium]|nr:hypothetical protein [Phycisphaerales bacterium]